MLRSNTTPDEAYFRAHQLEIEEAMTSAMNAVLSTRPANVVGFLAQHFHDLDKSKGAGGPQSEARRSLPTQVAAWQALQPQAAAAAAPGTEAEALSTKFAASASSFEYTYGGIEQFFGGLEGLIGTPSPDVMNSMRLEHTSDEPFEAWNADVKRRTTPRAEWSYVVDCTAGETRRRSSVSASADHDGRARAPSYAAEAESVHDGWWLSDFAAQPEIRAAGLLLAEVAGIRAYTGPMYALYNGTLRAREKGVFVTTLHAINSGIIKLSKQTPASTVYRGVAGGVLPDQFWSANEHGVMGGVELALMSTTTNRDIALGYMRQSGKEAKMLFEIRMGMIDRGADVSMLSQFPGEKEILFSPLTGLEVAGVPRVEDGVIVVELRLSCNLHDLTIEQVPADALAPLRCLSPLAGSHILSPTHVHV